MKEYLDYYVVEADRETGLWVSEPVKTGITKTSEFLKEIDSNDIHYDTFEKDDVTCAIEVRFVD